MRQVHVNPALFYRSPTKRDFEKNSSAGSKVVWQYLKMPEISLVLTFMLCECLHIGK